MFTELTEKQHEQLHKWYIECEKIGRSTTPTDRDKAKRSILMAYKLAGLKEPELVIFAQSPFSAQISANILRFLSENNKIGDQQGEQLRKQLWQQLGEQLGEQLRGQLWEQLRGQLWEQLWQQLGEQLEDQLEERLWEQLYVQPWEQLEKQLRKQLDDQLGWQLYVKLCKQLDDQLGWQLYVKLWEQLWEQLEEQLGEQLRKQLWQQLTGQIDDHITHQKEFIAYSSFLEGQGDIRWLAFYKFIIDIGAKCDSNITQQLDNMIEISKQTSFWYPFENICIVSDKPTKMIFNHDNMLHNDNGPAIEFSDGFKVYSYRGIRVNGNLIENKHKITLDDIYDETNEKIRRIKIHLYGDERYIKDSEKDIIC